MTGTTRFTCNCGKVACEIAGQPIVAVACHCDDCQAGGRQLVEAGADSVFDVAGATPYLLYRRDRVRCFSGAELLEPHKLKDGSITSRVLAGCCRTPMLVTFDRGLHWVSIYRDRLGPAAPALAYRVQTRFATCAIPADLPAYSSYPLSFVAKLVAARLAMLVS